MSVEAQAWAYQVRLKPCPKAVLNALANRADEDGYCWPGLADLELRTGWSRRAIQHAIRHLTDQQLLSVSPRHTESGQQTSNLFKLSLDPARCVEGAPRAPLGVHHVRGEGAPRAPLGVHHVRGEGAPRAPESSSESSEEQSQERTPGRSRRARRREPLSGIVWEGFRRGYVARYRVEPVRDAVTNAVLCTLVRSFGEEEAAQVAEYYCTLERKVYVENGHPPNLLLRDRYGIRTQMKTGPPKTLVVRPKAYQPAPAVVTHGEPCPPEAALALRRILGKESFSFTAEVAAV